MSEATDIKPTDPRPAGVNDPLLRAFLVLGILTLGWDLAGRIWTLAERFGDVIGLFFLAWLLAFMLRPIVRFLRTEFGLPRVTAVSVLYGVIFTLVAAGAFTVIPGLINQIGELGDEIPAISDQLPARLTALQAALAAHHIHVQLSAIYAHDFSQQLTDLGRFVVQNTPVVVADVASTFFNLVIIFLLSFYFLLDGYRIRQRLIELVPREHQVHALAFVDAINRIFGGYLLGILVQALVYGAGTALILLIAGLPYVVVVSALASLLIVVPFIGSLLAILPAIVIAVASNSASKLIFVVLGLIVLQQVVFNVIAPRLMSNSLGIHPLLLFFAMLMGSKVAGVAGAIFGVPIVAVLWAMVLPFWTRSTQARPEHLPTHPPVHYPRRFQRTGRLWQRLRKLAHAVRPPRRAHLDQSN